MYRLQLDTLPDEPTENRSIAVELLGAQTRFVQGARWKHRIIECGEGDALVLIHGVGGSAESWARNVRRLAEHFHVIAVDALYHGLSDKKPWSAELEPELQADAVADLLDALGVEWAHLEGESMGGGIAFEFAKKYPARCGGVILNVPYIARSALESDASRSPNNELMRLSREAIKNPSRETMRRRLNWLVKEPDRMTEEMLDLRAELYSRPGLREAMALMHHLDVSRPPSDVWQEEDFATFVPDVLVLWSSHNPGKGAGFGEWLAGLFPDAGFYVVEDAAHWPQWERPAEHDTVVVKFLSGSTRPSERGAR
ncbi:alpha/beta fold hydrolase [Actinomadura macra]|uniref:alpha/beta fold hydrolase n=1 Tax=Actinomadura macra TaxID=46164 RepID=UPI00082BF64B|nr:alpha/beta hydrolase [Actinomadura macra]